MSLSLDDARELLPLYAGGDLDPESQSAVATALETFAELRVELSHWAALEDRLQGAFTHDPAELLPLYAGGDLSPGQRADVEAELNQRPELGEDLAAYTALEGLLERSLKPQPLSPRQASELLPLHAGGDLDPIATRQVERAVAASPSLARELEGYRQVDTRLQAAYPPASEAAHDPHQGLAPLIRLQCPYCHDALQNAPVAQCVSCSTPHHTTCFEQNQGCSILGCEGTEAAAQRQATLRVCGDCGRHTQADAPFCAWCGSANTSRRAPLHARRSESAVHVLKPVALEGVQPDEGQPTDVPGAAPAASGPDWRGWLRAAAAIALTLSTLGAGLAFGQHEQARVRGWAASTAVIELATAERNALASLDAIREAQRKFRLHNWDGDEIDDYALSLAELRAAARGKQADTEALMDSSWETWFASTWSSTPNTPLSSAGYRVSLRLRFGGLGAQAGWTAQHEGGIEPLPPANGGVK